MPPSDNKIMIDITKRTRSGDLNWYKASTSTDYTDVWTASDKVTKLKALTYTIFNRKDNPTETHMIINLEKRKYNDNNKIVSAEIISKVRTIKSHLQYFLLKIAIESAGYEIEKYVIGIIEKNDRILFIRKYDPLHKGQKPGLPGLLIDSGVKDVAHYLDKEIKKSTGITVLSKEMMKYKSIFEHGGKYYYLTPYIILDYKDGHIDTISDKTWIEKDFIFNINIDKHTLDIIRFYIKNEDNYSIRNDADKITKNVPNFMDMDREQSIRNKITFLKNLKNKFKYIRKEKEFDYVLSRLLSLSEFSIPQLKYPVERSILELGEKFPNWFINYRKKYDL